MTALLRYAWAFPATLVGRVLGAAAPARGPDPYRDNRFEREARSKGA